MKPIYVCWYEVLFIQYILTNYVMSPVILQNTGLLNMIMWASLDYVYIMIILDIYTAYEKLIMFNTIPDKNIYNYSVLMIRVYVLYKRYQSRTDHANIPIFYV